ncbi:MAG: glycosyltransferase family 2 protein [Caulobacteraceae bacterium]
MSGSAQGIVGVSIVMPCLNETQSLPHCVNRAQEALAKIHAEYGLTGEVVVADNGSTDGSQALATSLGARVVPVSERGYGAALRGGFTAAYGRFLVMGDCDGSYDFCDAIPMIGALLEGADLCMGSRFNGGIEPGAMPWKNRYIGNPVLTGILNLLFRTGVDDAHCGLRALTKACFERLQLTGSGMEFASEMVIKAALRRETIVQRPATLSRDLRDRPPHLRPWRDGWRHLRYLFMLSPSWLFAAPALLGAMIALPILAIAGLQEIAGGMGPIGNYWVVLASALLGLSHIAAVLALAAHLNGVREGYQRPSRWTPFLAKWVSLETMILTGVLSGLIGLALLVFVVLSWSARNFNATYSVVPVVAGALFMTLGAQNVLGGFLLAIIGGNEARFMARVAADNDARSRPAQAARTAKRA